MKHLLTFLLLSFGFIVTAQSIEAGAWAGGTNSFNDLNTNSSFATIRPAGGVLGKYNFDERIAAELMLSYGRTYSSDAEFDIPYFQTDRNEASRTTSFDIQAAGEFNFLPFGGAAFTRSSVYTPYISAGVGLTFLDPEIYSRVENGWVSASSILTEDERDFNKMQITVPLAGGVKYQLNNEFVLAAEFGSRILFTDYYDDLSTVYNQVGVDNNPGLITDVGRQRGDRSRKDAYNLFGLQLTYIIPLNDCP